MKLDWSPVGAAVFSVVFIGLVTLIALGKVDSAVLGAILAWLIPSPIGGKSPALPPPAPEQVH